MKIVIAGAGEVGTHLAKLLSFEAQNITLIDIDKDPLDLAVQALDIRVLCGNATSLNLLKEAEVDKADLLIAVTALETVNIAICAMAKQLGTKQTIARTSNTELFEAQSEIDFASIGVDELISPEFLAADEISMLLDQSIYTDSYEFEEGALSIVGLRLPPDSTFVNQRLEDIVAQTKGLDFILVSVREKISGRTIIPRGDTLLKAGDQVFFTVNKRSNDNLYKVLGHVRHEVERLIILGASEIGMKLAQDLSKKDFKIKLIEKNEAVAFKAADILPNVMVIHGDGRNIDLLIEESVASMDAFVAVTGDSETNIMSCLLAKSRGVKKTIALVENIEYLQLLNSIGIDTVINKKILVSNSIFKHIRKGHVVSLAKLSDMHTEILEFKVHAKSKVCNKKIKRIDLPRTAVIGGVVRNGEGFISLGNFKIQEGDRVVVAVLPEAIKKVEKLFK